MIILDTNVISEPMRAAADRRVVTWLDAQSVETLYLTAISLSELLVGIESLADGKRKKGLGMTLSNLLDNLFSDRILPFDQRAARALAPLLVGARRTGHVISLADGQIAAIASVHGFSVATRDSAPFKAMGVAVIDPWS